jgi:RNA polymerase sigma factor (sigma-70 family)
MDLVRRFPPTRHSAVAAARSEDAGERARGLATLSSVYWRPVYSYLRLRWNRSHEEAADLAQDFFSEVLQKDLVARFDPSRARLRSWLRVCIDGVVANHDRAACRQKRGGGGPAAQFDFESVREDVEQIAGESPDARFEKDWARGVFAMALERLRQECETSGKAQHYALLDAYDLDAERSTYGELAERFGISLSDVTNRLFRTRRELRRIVLEVLRELTGSEQEFRDEARALLGGDAA